MRIGPLLLGLLASIVVTVPAAAAAAAAAAPDGTLLSVAGDTARISPNGDGRLDRVSLALRLSRKADVRVLVKQRDAVLQRYDVGSLSAGDHTWRWDGRAHGLVVPDGRYTLVVKARREPTTDRGDVTVVVDTSPDRGTLTTTRPTVYPLATQVADRVLVQYLRQGWDAQENADYRFLPLRVRYTVVAPDGSVVVRRDVERENTVPFEWYGRSSGGEPVSAGAYVVRARVLDPAGNVSRFEQAIQVSHQQLHAAVTSTTLAAASATPFSYAYPGSCLGCGDYCSPVPSSVLAGGIALGCDYFQSIGTYAAAVPFDAAPVDTARVTAVGQPRDTGSAAVAHLGDQVLGPGRDTATTAWRPVTLTNQPYLPDLRSPVLWSVWTDMKTYYDIESFTIEYRRWVPVEG